MLTRHHPIRPDSDPEVARSGYSSRGEREGSVYSNSFPHGMELDGSRDCGHHRNEHDLRRGLLLLLYLFYFFSVCTGAANEVQIGILNGDFEIAEHLLDLLPREDRSRLNIINLPNLTSEVGYDQLQKAHMKLESFQASVIIGRLHRMYHMASVKLRIPYITTSLQETQIPGPVFYLLPRPSTLFEVIDQLIRTRNWTQVGVIYDIGKDTVILNHLLRRVELDMKFGPLSPEASPANIHDVLLSFRRKTVSQFLVLTDKVRQVLDRARRLGMVSVPRSWLLLNLGSDDVSSGVLDDLNTDITSINLVEPPNGMTGDALASTDGLRRASLYDGLRAVARASKVSSNPLALADKLTQVDFVGDTGRVAFNSTGRRLHLAFTIWQREEDNFEKTGNYSGDQLRILLEPTTSPDRSVSLLQGRTVKVVTIMESPFCMKRSENGSTGNGRFYGFSVDMMDEISSRLGFKYELYEVPDKKFGEEQPDGSWNGMVREILDKTAEMSFAPLSINAKRENVIDFTKPFMTRRIAVLMRTPEMQSSYFQFMKPLSGLVWVFTLVSMGLISAALFVYEKNSTTCRTDMPRLNARESFWFIFGSLVQGSTESAPVTFPGRLLTGAWWFFSLILISTYTANLAAFLTVKKINPPISSVTDLADQSTIAFGTVRDSGIETFFKHTKVRPFDKMWTQMTEIFPDAMVNTTEEGFQKVLKGNYAFLWDSTVTSYKAATDCRFTQIGPAFDPKGFGMAVASGTTFREKLSFTILELSDQGRIAELEQKYWGDTICEDYSKPTTDETSELTLENAAGMFFVLIGGLFVGLIALGVERLLRKLNILKPKIHRSGIGMVDLRRT